MTVSYECCRYEGVRTSISRWDLRTPPTVQSTTVLAWHGQVPPYLFDTWLAGIQIPPYPFTTLKIRDIEELGGGAFKVTLV